MSVARVVTVGAAPPCSDLIKQPQIEEHSAPKGFEDHAATCETQINEVAEPRKWIYSALHSEIWKPFALAGESASFRWRSILMVKYEV